MKNRTFVLWLTAGIMLLSAVAGIFKTKNEADDEKTGIQEMMVQADEKESFVVPTEYTPIQAFGAIYNQELGQWTMQTQTVFAVEMNAIAYAPFSGQVENIERMADGGSCISLNCSGTRLKLFPIYNLSVLKGGRVNQGERLGNVSSLLNVYAEQDGQPINPQTLIIETTFPNQSRSDKES